MSASVREMTRFSSYISATEKEISQKVVLGSLIALKNVLHFVMVAEIHKASFLHPQGFVILILIFSQSHFSCSNSLLLINARTSSSTGEEATEVFLWSLIYSLCKVALRVWQNLLYNSVLFCLQIKREREKAAWWPGEE